MVSGCNKWPQKKRLSPYKNNKYHVSSSENKIFVNAVLPNKALWRILLDSVSDSENQLLIDFSLLCP